MFVLGGGITDVMARGYITMRDAVPKTIHPLQTVDFCWRNPPNFTQWHKMPFPIRYLPMKVRQLLLPALMALLLASCGGNVVLDNAKSVGVTFNIDGEDHPVGPNSSAKVSLGEGSHKVKITEDGGTVVKDTTVNVREGGILQSGTTYVVWRVLYGLQDKREKLLNEQPTEVDSTVYTADLDVFGPQDIYLEKNWDLGLDESLPDGQKLYITSDYKIHIKVFRLEDFKAEYTKLSAPAESH